jgi:hypothetical protein
LPALQNQEVEAAWVEESLPAVGAAGFKLCLGSGDPLIARGARLTATGPTECFEWPLFRQCTARQLGPDSGNQVGVGEMVDQGAK